MNIFLDDTRVPSDVTWVILPRLDDGESWVIAKSVEEFVSLLYECDVAGTPVKRVCFDHDLADEHYGDLNCNEGTGQDAAKALIQLLVTRKWPMPEYAIHTMNPIGAKKIKAILEIDFLKIRDGHDDYVESVWEDEGGSNPIVEMAVNKAKNMPVRKKANNGLAESEVFTNPQPHSAMKVVTEKEKPKAK